MPSHRSCLFLLLVVILVVMALNGEVHGYRSLENIFSKLKYIKERLEPKHDDPNRKPMTQTERIENIFDSVYINHSKPLEYGVVVVINKQGDVLFKKSYGEKDPFIGVDETTDPLDDIFSISEVTTTFTATSIMQLYESKLVEFDDNVNKYLPEELHFVNKIIGGYSSILRTPSIDTNESLTLTSILTHTAGLDGREIGSCSTQAPVEEEVNTPSKYLSNYLLSMNTPRIRASGFASSFSTIGYSTLGLVIERAANLSFHDYLNKNILGPAKMENTFNRYTKRRVGDLDSFVLPIIPPTSSEDSGEPNLLEVNPNFCWYTTGITPAVGMYSTTRDMARWVLTHLNFGLVIPSDLDKTRSNETRRIFSHKAAEIMYAEHFSSHPNCSITTGYGWNIEKKSSVKYLTSQGSFMHPYYSRIAVFHDQGVGIAILGRGKHLMWDLGFDLFVDKFIEKIPCHERKTIPGFNTTFVENNLGICAYSLKMDTIPPFSDDFNYITKYRYVDDRQLHVLIRQQWLLRHA